MLSRFIGKLSSFRKSLTSTLKATSAKSTARSSSSFSRSIPTSFRSATKTKLLFSLTTMAAVAVSLSSQPVTAESKSTVSASTSDQPSWPSSLSVKLRKSNDRGHANHGWLNSYHTFSFAGYYDEEYENFHSLRVINEDRVAPSRGFDTHPHREYEIFSYIVDGALSHRDSMNNNEIIHRGEVQFTTAGTGIAHSEFNASPKELVHFLQIWVKPNQSRLKPSYQTGRFADAEKRGKLRLIVSPDGAEGSLTIHQDMKVYASLLSAGETVTLPVQPGREYYIHVVQHINGFDAEHDDVGVSLNDKKSTLLKGGDGAFLLQDRNAVVGEGDAISLTGAGRGKQITEFILFDVIAQS